MTPYQIIILILKLIGTIREEYPADLLAARRASFLAQVNKRTCSIPVEQVRS